MILYCILTNAGGMKRVHQHLAKKKNVVVALLSEKKIKEQSNIYWVHCPAVKIEDLANTSIETQLNKLKEIVDRHKITGVICDYPSAIYIQHLKLPFVLDVHTLARPLYNAIISSPKRLALNATLHYPQIAAIEMLMYAYMKQENSIVSQACAFISNSRNTSRYLQQLYEIKKEKIFELPVTTEFSKKITKKYNKTVKRRYGYIFGRWHPQKGLENILLQDWRPLKLVVRGLDSSIFKVDALKNMKKNGIIFKKWTDSDKILQNELTHAEFVLFSSLYEPYGLALHEALALGCLCIAHKNKSGHEEQIRHGRNGFLIDMSRDNAVKKIQQILKTDPLKLKEIRKAAKKSKTLSHKSRDKKFNDMLQWAVRALNLKAKL